MIKSLWKLINGTIYVTPRSYCNSLSVRNNFEYLSCDKNVLKTVYHIPVLKK